MALSQNAINLLKSLKGRQLTHHSGDIVGSFTKLLALKRRKDNYTASEIKQEAKAMGFSDDECEMLYYFSELAIADSNQQIQI